MHKLQISDVIILALIYTININPTMINKITHAITLSVAPFIIFLIDNIGINEAFNKLFSIVDLLVFC